MRSLGGGCLKFWGHVPFPEVKSEKFKQLLRINKNVASAPPGLMKSRPEDFVLSHELMKEIGPESYAGQRIKTLKRLTEEISGKRMAPNSTETVWLKIRDLLNSQQPRANRQTTFAFLKALIHSQYDALGLMRAEFFNFLCTHDVPEDLTERIELLKELSKSGREIEHFEDEIGPFLLQYTSSALSSTSALEFLQIMVNLIKFHSAYLDKDVVMHIVWLTCHYACRTTLNEGVVHCLQVLEAVICYSCLPSDSLECIITTLCRTVNVEKFSTFTWKLVRNLLGTHLGHSALYIMCDILQQSENRNDVALLRGAVFFIGMCLWGSQKVGSLKFTYSVVLPYFLYAINHGDTTVAHEVSLSIQRLVRKYGKELQPGTWDLILDIIEALIEHTQANATTSSNLLASNVHEILSTIEQLHSQKQYNGCENRLFSIIENCAMRRPESSVLRLLNFRANSINPLKSNWLSMLKGLLDKYYKHETRTAIRLKALDILSSVLRDTQHIYEDDILDKIILPFLNHIENDQDLLIRNSAVLLLLTVAEDCSCKSCLEILEILSKVILNPYDQAKFPGGKQEAQETVHVISESEIIDVKSAIEGLTELFKKKIYTSSASTITIFRILVKHMHLQYDSLVVSKDASTLRTMIFECLLKLRANEHHQLGIVHSDSTTANLQFSPYLLCSHGEKSGVGASSPPLSSPTPFAYSTFTPAFLSLEQLFQIITVALKCEKDWSVLKYILLELPKLLQNKSLLLSSPGSVGALCGSICALLGDRNLHLPETLRNAPVTLSRSEFHLHVYPIQVALVSYHKHLDINMQRFLVTCLRHGLISKCARACIVALTVCILEMTDTMYKLLPEVLLGLSKISATVNIAIPILEFLSTLIRLPKLYASFVQDQYMSIFAIALPYTNPFKFNHYAVSIAHHVIAMWFIKCRLPFRKDFVRFIVKGLRNNVLVPFDEGAVLSDVRSSQAESKDQDHSFHKRGDVSEALATFHKELTETCIDLLTRYTFACCSVLPKRSPLAEFLLTSGQSMTWLLGNAIITITTSGCNTRATKYGLCEKCYSFCKGGQSSTVEETSVADAPGNASEMYQTRRRHRSAAVHRSLSIDSHEHVPRSKDDMQLRFGNKDAASSLSGESAIKNDPAFAQSHGSSEPHICSCWCQGWAEILIRRPTGNTSWVTRIQNQLNPLGNSDFPLSEIARLLLLSHFNQFDNSKSTVNKFGHERIDSESLEESECDAMVQQLLSVVANKDKFTTDTSTIPEHSIELSHGSESSVSDRDIETSQRVIHQDQEVPSEITEHCEASEKLSLRRSNSSPDIRMEFQIAEAKPFKNKDQTASVYNKMSSNTTATSVSSEMSQSQQSKVVVQGFPASTSTSNSNRGSIVSQIITTRDAEIHTSDKITPKVGFQDSSFNQVSETSSILETKANASHEEGRLRRGSGIMDKKPPRLPDIGEQRTSSPVAKTTSAPLSPLPLVQVGVDHPDLPPLRRDRGHTISVMSPVRHKWLPGVMAAQQRVQEGQQQGINPSFVFLQLYYSFRFGSSTDRPLLLPKSESVERALKLLDHIPPYDTHKIGVIYVGLGQADNEGAVLANEFGSIRYINFLHGLGHLIRLKDINPREVYVGGLDLSGTDGKFAYVWQDDVTQVIFHVATLMPNKKQDPSCNDKKLHIGNDFVCIVYNNSGQDYNIHTIKGQFIYVCVVIQPLDQDSNLVTLKTKPELHFGCSEPKIVSDHNLPILVRQLALHANLASMIRQSQERSTVDPYASNWLERLRHIRRLREKRLAEVPPPSEDDSPGPEPGWSRHMDDFTGFV